MYTSESRRSPRRHAPDAAAEYRRRRERRERELRRAGPPGPASLDAIADRDALYRAFEHVRAEGGPGAGPDGVRAADLSGRDVGAMLDTLSHLVRGGHYRPGPARAVAVPKAAGGVRVLRVGNLVDRVVARALHAGMEDPLEATFLPCSWGGRRGRGVWGLLAELERSVRRSGRRVLAVADVRTAFDAVPLAAVRESHRRLLLRHVDAPAGPARRAEAAAERRRLLDFVGAVLGPGTTEPGRGIPQGNNYAPAAMNLAFHHYLDRPMVGRMASPPWFRYVDNVAFLARGVHDGEERLGRVRTLLEPHGMELKDDAAVVDLGAGDSADMLGFRVTLAGDSLTLDLHPGAEGELAAALERYWLRDDPVATGRQYIRGWIDAHAPAIADGDTAVGVIGSVCGHMGLRDLLNPEDVRAGWNAARRRWDAMRAGPERRA